MIIVPSNVSGAALGLSDDFNRANSTSGLGTPWVAIQGTLGIKSNAAYGVSDYCYSYYPSAVFTENFKISVVRLAAGSYTWMLIGTGSTFMAAQIGSDYSAIYGSLSFNQVGTKTINGTSPGTVTFQRVGNVYSLLTSDGQTSVSFTDSANSYPGSTYKYAGIGFSNVADQLPNADSWTVT